MDNKHFERMKLNFYQVEFVSKNASVVLPYFFPDFESAYQFGFNKTQVSTSPYYRQMFTVHIIANFVDLDL